MTHDFWLRFGVLHNAPSPAVLLTPALVYHEKRHPRSRFSWVKRLVQGQNRTMPGTIRNAPYERTIDQTLARRKLRLEDALRRSLKSVEFETEPDDNESGVLLYSDAISDNVSTKPLKLIVSVASTNNSPSILSGEHAQDNNLYVALTGETLLAPSHVTGRTDRERERDRERDRDQRDSELIITLASLSRRVRRRSIDTNCLMAGIAPASIMEQIATPAPEDARSSE